MSRRRLSVPLSFLLLSVAACQPSTPVADLVLRGGKVVTMDSNHPQAEALAVVGDTVAAVGTDDEIATWVGEGTRVIDLQGAFVVPGFIESHGHFMGLGSSLQQIDLMETRTWTEIVDLVRAAAAEAEPGAWIQGRGWHQEKWDQAPARIVAGFQTNDLLNEAAPNNPVLLTHASGHASIANDAALRAAGVDASTSSPSGGQIIKDAEGRPTGILVDAAESLVGRALSQARADRTPEQVEANFREQVRLAAQEALSKGVTSFQDMGASLETVDGIKEIADEGGLPLRLYILVDQGEVTPENEQALAAHRMVDHADGHLTVRAIGEVTADGALGSRSAWMLQPYSDDAESTGLNVTSMERIAEIAEIGLRNGFQIATHAIGDRANRETLDLYERIFQEQGVDGDTLRWRIEHAQHLNPVDIPRFSELGVIASMQAIHACSDAPYVGPRLADQRSQEGAYVWKSLWGIGAIVTNGTDVPVENIDPFASYHCTVTRAMVGSDELFYPDQALTREQALQTYTTNGAYAAFEERQKGKLAPGMLADLAVLSRDITTVPPEEILGTEALYTVVGGEVVYERDGGGM
jgi:predicted amidohydrolase YtcJ